MIENNLAEYMKASSIELIEQTDNWALDSMPTKCLLCDNVFNEELDIFIVINNSASIPKVKAFHYSCAFKEVYADKMKDNLVSGEFAE